LGFGLPGQGLGAGQLVSTSPGSLARFPGGNRSRPGCPGDRRWRRGVDLVDDLLDRGYTNVTVLDLSAAALDVAKGRLGSRAAQVKWICADVTDPQLPSEAYEFWHDRAVFHFLREPAARARYVSAVRRMLKPGGHIVVATFGPHGPEKCSGLDVMHFTPEALHAEFGPEFARLSDAVEMHTTPWGSEQEFVYCYCRLRE